MAKFSKPLHSNGHIVRAELDHVVSVHEIHTNPKVHLALGKVRKNAETGELNVDVSRIRDLANHDENLALTNQPLNGSKSDQRRSTIKRINISITRWSLPY